MTTDLLNQEPKREPAPQPKRRSDEPIRPSYTIHRFRFEGTHSVRFRKDRGYYRDALDWYRENVNPNGDDADLMGYVTRCAIEGGPAPMRTFDGIGTVRTMSHDEARAATFAKVHAMTSDGFLVQLPVLRDFEPTAEETRIA